MPVRKAHNPTPLTAGQQALVEANLPLAYWWCKRLRARGEDAIAVARTGLVLAAQRFDPTRNCQFSTFASWLIRAAIQDWRRSESRERALLFTDLETGTLDGGHYHGRTVAPPDLESETLERARRLLPKRLWLVLHLVFVEGLSQPAIGRRLGMSGSRVGQMRRQALGLLRKRLPEESYA